MRTKIKDFVPIPIPYAEIKRQKLLALGAEYSPQFAQLDADAISAKVLFDDVELFDAIMEERTELENEYFERLEVIKNG